MTDISSKPDTGHVLFWLSEEDGREFATCAAADFRTAMTERDELRAENERLSDEHAVWRAKVNGLTWAQVIDGLKERDGLRAKYDTLNEYAHKVEEESRQAAFDYEKEIERFKKDRDYLYERLKEQLARVNQQLARAAAAEAEVERLNDLVRLYGKRIEGFSREAAEARAENERLNLLLHNNQVRREEVEARHGDLLRQVERLRAALERLVDIGPSATLKEWRDAQAAGAEVLGR